MNVTKLVEDIVTLHKDSIENWYVGGVTVYGEGLLKVIVENHAFNFKLWQAEDRARREDKGFEFVYLAKREIDSCNQQRNNKMEEIDGLLYNALCPAHVTDCKVNSETPGMIIDRLSILSLKLYHMLLQSNRQDVSVLHRDKCMQKSQVIASQKEQLGKCLSELLQEVMTKTRTFRVYHQFKMYNDPTLNPELYKSMS